MGDIVLFDPHPDPALVLLRTFHYRRQGGDDPMTAYTFSKNIHPHEFEIVSGRAREHGHQFGVVGDRYKYRQELVLKGHHSHLVNGVCIGNESVTCIVIRYPTHNFSIEDPVGYRIGGSGGQIKNAFRQGRRILQDQHMTVYNEALELSVASENPVRLYEFVGPQRTGLYVYRGLFYITYSDVVQTDNNLNCFEYYLIPAPENQIPPIVQEFPIVDVEWPEEAPEEAPLLLEWPQEGPEDGDQSALHRYNYEPEDHCTKLQKSKQYCGVCMKIWHHSDGGNWVCSDGCDVWVHAECDKISGKLFKIFKDKDIHHNFDIPKVSAKRKRTQVSYTALHRYNYEPEDHTK